MRQLTSTPCYAESSAQHAEQAIVQLAHNALSGREVAVKVFATRTAFTAEAALLCNTASPLRGFMPALLALHDNPAGALQGAAGAPLPPCIVMDKGEPLDVLCHMHSPSRSATFLVRPRAPQLSFMTWHVDDACACSNTSTMVRVRADSCETAGTAVLDRSSAAVQAELAISSAAVSAACCTIELHLHGVPLLALAMGV